VLRGIAGGAGEFGHVVIDPDGPLCRCGNRGCLEVYASFRGALGEAERHFGRAMRMNDIVDLAMGGDTFCRSLVERAGEAGGHGLGVIGSVFDPPLVVVSGRLALTGDMLLEPLRRSYERYALIKHDDVPDIARTQVRASTFSDGACLGADLLLVRLEHALVLPHLRDEARAQVAIATVLRLTLMVLQRLEERLVLHHRIVDLALQEILPSIHEYLAGWVGDGGCTSRATERLAGRNLERPRARRRREPVTYCPYSV